MPPNRGADVRPVLLLALLTSLSVAAERPNIVFMLSDGQGWGDLGFTGNQQISTPNNSGRLFPLDHGE